MERVEKYGLWIHFSCRCDLWKSWLYPQNYPHFRLNYPQNVDNTCFLPIIYLYFFIL